MTWAAQVWHVFRKDMVHMRWMLLGYVLCVLVMITRRGFPSVPTDTADNVLSPPLSVVWLIVPLLLVAYSMFLVIIATLDESAAKADAAWRVLPLDASAVLAAKLLVIGSLIVIGVAGQSLRVSQMALDRTQWLFAIGSTATTLLGWLLLALLVASVSRSLVGTISSIFIGAPALYAATVVVDRVLKRSRSGARMSYSYPDWPGDALWTHWPYAALILVSIIASIMLYRRMVRDRWAGGVSATLCVLLGFAGCGPRVRWGVADRLPSSIQIASTSEVPSPRAVTQISTKISVTGLGPTDRLVLDSGSLVLVVGERDTVRAPLGYQGGLTEDEKGVMVRARSRHEVLKEPSVVPTEIVAWPIRSRESLTTLFDSLPPALVERLRSERVQVSVSGVVFVLRGSVSARAIVGAPPRWDRGVRIAAYDTVGERGEQAFAAPLFALTALHPAGAFERNFAPFGMTALLLREPMRDALPLYFRGATIDVVPLVLPGLGGQEMQAVFGTGGEITTEPAPVLLEKGHTSTFMIVGWREIGRYKIATRPTLLQRVIADSL
ncbi:MAG: hypothetical protein IT353_24540 [Gemmatimonadaceae bacterium]|nr:hypothetical protein [Gemmatimonadaceae bacterium]